MKIDVKKLKDVEIGGVDPKDYPDMVDAYISHALYHEYGVFRDLTEDELEWVNDNHPEIAQELAGIEAIGG
jgi:hypothetical protein